MPNINSSLMWAILLAGNSSLYNDTLENQTVPVTTATAVPTRPPTKIPPNQSISWDDATWILTSAFIIFTMQSGEIIIGIFVDSFGTLLHERYGTVLRVNMELSLSPHQKISPQVTHMGSSFRDGKSSIFT